MVMNGQLPLNCPCICVAGNHESGYLNEVENGGFIAPNLYYIGEHADLCLVLKGKRMLRFRGISGISHEYPAKKRRILTQEDRDAHSPHRIIAASLDDVSAFDRTFDGPALYVTHDWPQGIEHKIPKKKLISDMKDY